MRVLLKVMPLKAADNAFIEMEAYMIKKSIPVIILAAGF